MSRVFETDITLNAQRELRLADADSSAYVGFKAPSTITTNRIWTLPSADGTSGQVLSTDGSGVLSWATAGGGGGLTHFVESESTAAPNATVPVDALTATDASYTNIDVALVAKGTGATLAQIPDGTTAGGNKRGQYATDWQKGRTVSTQIAAGLYSVLCGGYRNSAVGNRCAVVAGENNLSTGSFGFIGGGSGNTTGSGSAYHAVTGGLSNAASSDYSFVGGGQSNIAQTNTHAAVCGGQGNTASGLQSFVGGGGSNNATGTNSAVSGGSTNTASSTYSTVVGGYNNIANANAATVGGGAHATTRSIQGNYVIAPCFAPIVQLQGRTQVATLLLARQTTDATATVLTSNTSAASTTNQVILPNNSAYSFSGEVIAGVTAAGNTARWTIDGAIKRGANAASTAMVGTPTVTMTHNDAGASTWSVAVAADTTNGGIKVEVTGAAATTIRWVCRINTVEVTY